MNMHNHERSPVRLEISTKEELAEALHASNVDTSGWGKIKGSKTVSHLLEEIIRGETVLLTHNGTITRMLSPITAKVFYHAPDGGEYVLVEDHQFFMDDGRMKDRSHLPDAVGEKMLQGETIQQGLDRAFEEELKMTPPFIDVRSHTPERVVKPSGSYPGLMSDETLHRFEVDIRDDQYVPEGYVEVTEDKVTCFSWKRIS